MEKMKVPPFITSSWEKGNKKFTIKLSKLEVILSVKTNSNLTFLYLFSSYAQPQFQNRTFCLLLKTM